MYNKIFTKILDSSIWLEPNSTRIVWITMIAAMDEHGFCQFASAANVAQRAVVCREDAESAIRTLESPDPDSSDPDNEGRRIEKVPGGWMVLNAEKYRTIVTRATGQENTRKRVREFRERKRNGFDQRIASQNNKCDCCHKPFEEPYSLYVVSDHNHETGQLRGLLCQACNRGVGMVENGKTLVTRDRAAFDVYIERWMKQDVTQVKRQSNVRVTTSYTEAYTDTKTKNKELSAKAEEIYQAYPRKIGRANAIKSILRACTSTDAAELLRATAAFAASPAGQNGKYTPHPATWFNQARYQDDPKEWEKTGENNGHRSAFDELIEENGNPQRT